MRTPPAQRSQTLRDPASADNPAEQLRELIGCQVVLDVRGPYIYLGTLQAAGPEAFVLKDADVHFTEEGGASSELYIRDAAADGIFPTREQVYVMRSEVVSISRVSDVIGQ
jgi:hypothetical protein